MSEHGKVSTDEWYTVDLISEADFKTGQTGKLVGDLTVEYKQLGSGAGWTSYSPAAGNWQELGDGEYAMQIGAGEFGSTGRYQVHVQCVDCLTYRFSVDVRTYNIEDLFSGYNVILKLDQLDIQSQTATEPAIKAIGNTSGSGIFAQGGTTGPGIEAEGAGTGPGILATGGPNDGCGIEALSDANASSASGHGIRAIGGASEGLPSGIWAESVGPYAVEGHGIYAKAIGSAAGIYGEGGATGAGAEFAGLSTGHGIKADGGATGHGALFTGGSTSGTGMTIDAGTSGSGLVVTGAGSNTNGIEATGVAAGNGMQLNGGATGHGLKLYGGGTSGNGIYAEAQGGNSNAVHLIGDGTGAGFYAIGGATGNGAEFDGVGTGHGIYSKSGTGATGDGMKVEALSTNGNGLMTVKTGTGIDLHATDHGDGSWATATPLTSQEVRDAMKLAPTGGAPAAGSIDEHLDDVPTDVDTTLTSSHGAGAWTSASSDPSVLQSTTMATVASQTEFTLNAGSTDDDAYNGCYVVIEDASTAVQKAVGIIMDYVGSTKTVTLLADPGVFTFIATDKVDILAAKDLELMKTLEGTVFADVNAIPVDTNTLVLKNFTNIGAADYTVADVLKNRVVTFRTGVAKGQSVAITAQGAISVGVLTLSVSDTVNFANIAVDDRVEIT